ncbi:MAG: tetraacyldisaccharide 4'-kinase [Helicobacteraceae bacterium]|nr:tetraacyldisaccharide 4'-kinase [Helicobacteraceae bacterium]
MVGFVESLLFEPRGWLQHAITRALVPLSGIYGAISWRDLTRKQPKNLGVKVISVGNITIGGSGKTPLTAALATLTADSAIVLRGYGRKTKGLIVVDDRTNVFDVGDEALLYKELAPKAIVIVSADRALGALKAKALGAKTVFLDDGFRHRHIAKFDILIAPNPPPANRRLLPAGCYRYYEKAYAMADFIAQEGRDFFRSTSVVNPSDRMALVTAVSRAKRLEPFLPPVVARYHLRDHSFFDERTLRQIMQKHEATSLLVTAKDAVKMRGFDLPLSLLDLKITIGEALQTALNGYCQTPKSA